MYTLLRWFITRIFMRRYHLTFEGVENCPKEGGYIYASNHRSYFGPVLISLPVRKRFAYMAKEELFQKNIFFSLLIRMMGAFPVQRGAGDLSVIETSVAKLKQGKNLVIFPEGTRSYDGKVGRGKSGVALIAASAGVDVIPVGIVFAGPKMQKGVDVTVKFGPRICAEELKLSVSESGAAPAPAELRALKKRIMESIKALAEPPLPALSLGSPSESDAVKHNEAGGEEKK